jgi:hypothetical protein
LLCLPFPNFRLIPIDENEILVQTVLIYDAITVFIGILEIMQNTVRVGLESDRLDGAGTDHRRGKRIKTAEFQNNERKN